MKRPRSSLSRLLFGGASLAVLVVLGVAGVPGLVLGGEAAEHPGVMEAVRRVQVHRIWCEPGMDSDPETGFSLYAHVEAVGLKWRSLVVEVRLRTPDGKPVRAAKGAPEGYADEKGRFFMSARVPVFDDPFEWPELRASIPYEKALDLPAARPWRLIATFRASCEGLSSVSEAEITVPPAKAPGVKRALRLLAIDPFPNSPPPKETTAADDAHPKDDSRGPAGHKRGLMVEGYVAAEGLRCSKIVGQLVLQGEDGKPLLRKDPKTGAGKPVQHSVESDVVADQAQILLHFLSHDALGLEPGRHRLILSYTATCDGLTASLEEEHVVGVPDANE